MIYTKLTRKAMQICVAAHKLQQDKGGMPYVFHPFHLAEQMETEEETCTALLHDVVEDTDWTLEALAAEGFPPAVMAALALLTHDDAAPYLDYVRRLADNRIAARVKLADLRHNSTAGRLPVFTGKDRARIQKYLRAQAILTGGEADPDQMTLRLRYRIPRAEKEFGASRETENPEAALLTAVLAPDGSVREYVLEYLPAPTGTSLSGLSGNEAQDRFSRKSFRNMEELVPFLEEQGLSAAAAVKCLACGH